MKTLSLRSLVVAVGFAVAAGSMVSTAAKAEEWGDHGHHEREWRDHDRDWRENDRDREWREHHYAPPPVVYAPAPRQGYYVAPPPVVAVPSGLNIVLPLNFR